MKSIAINSPEGWYRFFRIYFGVVLVLIFYRIFLDSYQFVNPGGLTIGQSPLSFVNLLFYLPETWMVQIFAIVAMLASAALAFGADTKWSYLFLWYAWLCFHGRVYFAFLPSEGYVGWLLLGLAVVPPRRDSKLKDLDIEFKNYFGPLAWLVVCIAYSYSGYSKIMSPVWYTGMAFKEMLGTNEFRQWLTADLINSTPAWIFSFVAWFTILIELLSVFFLYNALTRKIWWWGITLMHIGIFSVIGIEAITFAMLGIQIFLRISIKQSWSLKTWSNQTIEGSSATGR